MTSPRYQRHEEVARQAGSVFIKISLTVGDVWFMFDNKHRRTRAGSWDSQGRLLVVHLSRDPSKLLGDGTGVCEQSETSRHRSVVQSTF